jgi:hypothetical protein
MKSLIIFRSCLSKHGNHFCNTLLIPDTSHFPTSQNAGVLRVCEKNPFMLREPRHERKIVNVNNVTPFALSLVAGRVLIFSDTLR